MEEPLVSVKHQRVLYGLAGKDGRIAVLAIPKETTEYWNHKGFKKVTIFVGAKHNLFIVPRGIQKGKRAEVERTLDRLDRLLFTLRKKKKEVR